MKKLTLTLFLTLLINTPLAMAGTGHDHGHSHSLEAISSEEVIKRATSKVQNLITKEKIDASWSAIKASSAEQKTFNKKKEWVISFNNEKVSDTKKQTLYLFFSLDGHYIAANFTGE